MIPKILHLIWVGLESRRPDALIATWVQQHPDWEVKLWDNQALVETDWRCRAQLIQLGEYDAAGVADLMRWEILLREGGVVAAADSVCLRPLDASLLAHEAFACWESELAAPGLISTSCVGCAPGNRLMAELVERIGSLSDLTQQSLSESVGAAQLTRCWRELGYANLSILPSHSFIPRHPDAPPYTGGGTVYACELWASRLGLLDALAGIDPTMVAEQLARADAESGAPSLPASADPAIETAPRPPRFSIVIPTYNRRHDLPTALSSALEQSWADYEIVVADDGSTDGTDQFLAQFDHPRVRSVRIEHRGVSACRNAALAEAQGDYIVCLDSDDALMPDCLALYAARLDAEPDIDVLYGNLIVADADWHERTRWHYSRQPDQPSLSKLFQVNSLPNPGTAIRRELALRLGGYDEALPSSVDYDLWIRAAAADARFAAVDDYVCIYRLHGDNLSGTAERRRASNALIAWKTLQQVPLQRLYPQLDWQDRLRAEVEACGRAANLLTERAHWLGAAEMLERARGQLQRQAAPPVAAAVEAIDAAPDRLAEQVAGLLRPVALAA
ncbi:MAG: glycosyltransferase [Leptothrix sp. (in: b-proteobacteria)]